MKHNIKIHKTMIQLSIIFSTIAFYYECCKSGRKRGEREATLNQGDSPSFRDTCHVWCPTLSEQGPLRKAQLEPASVLFKLGYSKSLRIIKQLSPNNYCMYCTHGWLRVL